MLKVAMDKQLNLTQEEAKRRVEMTLKGIEKDFGMGACQILGDAKPVPLSRFHSGSYKINEVLGGGYPRGRIIEIYGPESSGKTTVTLHAVAEIQKQETQNYAVFIDAEHALDINYAADLGVNVKDLIVAQPDTAEDCLQIAERWIRSGAVGLVVIDSVAAMIPKNELEGEIGDNHIGLMARLMSQALRKLAGIALKTGTTVIFINQIREKVGVMFGNPETTTGGRALKFYASIRLDIRPKEIKKGSDGEAVSRMTQIKAVKNKTAAPFRQVEVDIEFGEGISKSGEVLDIGEELGLVKKSGAWYSYWNENGEEIRLGQGRDNAKKFLKANEGVLDFLDERIATLLYPEEIEFVPQEIEAVETTLADEEAPTPDEEEVLE